VGETITKGEAIAVIETDKVTMDLEADCEGILLAIVHGDGDVVKATHTIAWVGSKGEDVPGDKDNAEEPAPTAAPALKVAATPAARAHAAKEGLDLSSIAGSGPGGAIRMRDMTQAKPMTTAPAAENMTIAGQAVPLTGMRRAIAEKMLRSHQQVPSVTLVTRADITELAALRARMNDGGETKVSWTDFVLRAAAAARDLADRARAGSLSHDECAGGTFNGHQPWHLRDHGTYSAHQRS
jgi:pyruvate dehydrogenase E2 component (dihydrolipoamide acetyltransferase)